MSCKKKGQRWVMAGSEWVSLAVIGSASAKQSCVPKGLRRGGDGLHTGEINAQRGGRTK